MLYVMTEHSEISWTVGTKFPLDDCRAIVEIQADGPELSLICKQIDGIPKTHQSNKTSWFGDDAKFIVQYLIAVSQSVTFDYEVINEKE